MPEKEMYRVIIYEIHKKKNEKMDINILLEIKEICNEKELIICHKYICLSMGVVVHTFNTRTCKGGRVI